MLDDRWLQPELGSIPRRRLHTRGLGLQGKPGVPREDPGTRAEVQRAPKPLITLDLAQAEKKSQLFLHFRLTRYDRICTIVSVTASATQTAQPNERNTLMTYINPLPSPNERNHNMEPQFPLYTETNESAVPSGIADLASRLKGLFDPRDAALVLATLLVNAGNSIEEAATLVDGSSRVTFHTAQDAETWSVTSFLRHVDNTWESLDWTEPREAGDDRPAFTAV